MNNTHGTSGTFKFNAMYALTIGSAFTALMACSPRQEVELGTASMDSIAATSVAAASDGEKGIASKYNLNKYLSSKTVCDPFNGGVAETPKSGLKTTLFYKGAQDPRFYKVGDYISSSIKSSQTLFLNDVNVPTRMFSEGFPSQSGNFVKDDAGNKLIEFFALKMETVVKLAPEDAEGVYEFSSLGDDGVVIKYRDIQGIWRELVNNDGDHPTRMGCSAVTIKMTRETEVPFEVHYYQGPRYHIANVVMWRRVDVPTPTTTTTVAPRSPYIDFAGNPSSCLEIGPGASATCSCNESSSAPKAPVVYGPGKDPLCGKSGNEYFFDPNHGSVALSPYKQLLSRGWKPLKPSNYYITQTDEYNPCVVGTNPEIVGFQIKEQFEGTATFIWSTDIPASSQLILKNVATGAEISTTSDNMLVKQHTVKVTGLELNQTYDVRAVSISEDLGKTISDPIKLITVRVVPPTTVPPTTTTTVPPVVNPIISGVQVQSQVEGIVTIVWTTDIPASSQLIVKNMASGAVITTAADNNLVKQHSVTVSGLALEQSFQIQAVSVSGSKGKSTSAPVTVFTALK